jgi:hypothetical protein
MTQYESDTAKIYTKNDIYKHEVAWKTTTICRFNAFSWWFTEQRDFKPLPHRLSVIYIAFFPQ